MQTKNNQPYYLSLPEKDQSLLGTIRHWEHLKISHHQGTIWIKGWSSSEITAKEVQCLPEKTIYRADQNYLYPIGHLLPQQRVPNLLWTPIARGLPLEWPRQNHNFFGIPDRIKIQLIPSNDEQKPAAILLHLNLLTNYIESAPASRLKPLKWTLFNNNKALVLGRPTLPLPGKSYWQNQSFLLPAGWQLQYPILQAAIHQHINPNNDALILWTEQSNHTLIKKQDLQPLSISSFRKTIHPKNDH